MRPSPITAEVDLAEAALFRMAGVARDGARLAKIGPGDVGCGAVGPTSAARSAFRLGPADVWRSTR
jgi:hypothetical protein